MVTEGGEDMWTEALTRAGKILHCISPHQPLRFVLCIYFKQRLGCIEIVTVSLANVPFRST